MKAYNLDFNLIERIVEPLIGGSDKLGDTNLGKASLFGVMVFGISQNLGRLNQLRAVSIFIQHHSCTAYHKIEHSRKNLQRVLRTLHGRHSNR